MGQDICGIRHVWWRQDMARRRHEVPAQVTQDYVVIHVTLPVAQYNALQAVLSHEGTTIQAYFAAKATAKIVQGPGAWLEGPQGVADGRTPLDGATPGGHRGPGEQPAAVEHLPCGPVPLRHHDAQTRVSSQTSLRLARLDAILARCQTAGQPHLWVRDGAQMHSLELATLRERLAQALAQQHLLCVRCLHVWQPFIPDPVLCPQCQQDWSRPYRRRPYGARAPRT